MAELDRTYLIGGYESVLVDENPEIVPVNCSGGSFVYYQFSEGLQAVLYVKLDDGLTTNVYKIVRRNNYNATNEPSISDDLTKGYDIGSEWYYNGDIYKCVNNASKSAVWKMITFIENDGTV